MHAYVGCLAALDVGRCSSAAIGCGCKGTFICSDGCWLEMQILLAETSMNTPRHVANYSRYLLLCCFDHGRASVLAC